MLGTGPKFPLNYSGMTIRYEEAIERARSIVPVAKKNVQLAEEMRRIPEENARAILESGLMPLMRPKMFGGFEADWMTQIDCVSEVAQHCGSTGWVMTFFLQHQFFLSLFPLEAQRFVYERHKDPTILTSFFQTGSAKEVPGGYEVGGRWHFGSGGDYCNWAILGGVIRNPDGTIKKRLNFLLKPEQFKIDRVWDAIGLRGSGSNDIVVEPTFVPESFVYDHDLAMIGKAQGQSVHEGVLYRAPLVLNSGFAVMTPMHGIARGCYDAFVALTGGRAARPMGARPADRVETQIAIGESGTDALRQRRDMMMVLKLIQRAVDRLFDLSGTHGLLGNHAIQRHWRDIHAIGHHAQWQAPALQTAGREELGLPPLPGDSYPLD
jgi:3-hydroxy-9,10-secoandrosta-1,3,5(10)-triene-9,17-dione monooxygenase